MVGSSDDADESLDSAENGQKINADDEEHPTQFIQPIRDDVVKAEGGKSAATRLIREDTRQAVKRN